MDDTPHTAHPAPFTEFKRSKGTGMPVVRPKATCRYGRGVGHEARVQNRGNHTVSVKGTISQVIYGTAKSGISSWAKGGEGRFYISGPGRELLACLGAVHPEDSGLQDKNPFNFSVHCQDSARIISRILQLSPHLAGGPVTEATYLAAVVQAREENADALVKGHRGSR